MGNRSPSRRRAATSITGALLLVAALLGGCAQASSAPFVAAGLGKAPVGSSAQEAPVDGPAGSADVRLPPVWSPGMDRTDGVGAAAAAEHFLELFVYAQTTGDVLAWNLVSDDACAFCASVRDDVTQVYGAGGRYTDYELAVGPVTVVDHEEALGVFTVEARYASTAGRLVGSRGEVLDEIPAEAGALLLDVTYADIGWMMLRGDVSTEV